MTWFYFLNFNKILIQINRVFGECTRGFSALIVSGAYRLATVVNKPPPITGDQAVKFANYFLSRRSVQTSKGAYSLLDILNILTNNKVRSNTTFSQL